MDEHALERMLEIFVDLALDADVGVLGVPLLVSKQWNRLAAARVWRTRTQKRWPRLAEEIRSSATCDATSQRSQYGSLRELEKAVHAFLDRSSALCSLPFVNPEQVSKLCDDWTCVGSLAYESGRFPGRDDRTSAHLKLECEGGRLNLTFGAGAYVEPGLLMMYSAHVSFELRQPEFLHCLYESFPLWYVIPRLEFEERIFAWCFLGRPGP